MYFLTYLFFVSSHFSFLSIFSHLSTYELEVGQTIGVVSMILDSSQPGNFSRRGYANRRDVIAEAVMEVILPDGTEEDITMHDDGLHMDGVSQFSSQNLTF